MIKINFHQLKNQMTNKINLMSCLEINLGLVRYKYLKAYHCVCFLLLLFKNE